MTVCTCVEMFISAITSQGGLYLWIFMDTLFLLYPVPWKVESPEATERAIMWLVGLGTSDGVCCSDLDSMNSKFHYESLALSYI